ncbi:MAG: chorismate synthase [Clostridia bacterium]|nr:chorismate synthase [Clostridia bacterium]
MSKFNGKNITVEIYGESHAEKIGVKATGFPRFTFSEDKLNNFLARRKANKGVFSTSRKELDAPIFTGVNNGEILGDFSADIYNQNTRSNDYDNLIGKPRPSHADYVAYVKNGVTNFAGGGRFSGRLTAPLCVVGGIAKQYLESLGIYVSAYVSSVGEINAKSYKNGVLSYADVETLRNDGEFPSLDKKEEILNKIATVKAQGNSVGGTVECVVYGLKAGVGDNLFDGLEGKISRLIYSIPAVKGVEFGLGFDIAKTTGSTANDELYYDNNGEVNFYSNNAGGINGGISNGNLVTMRVAFRPTPSISKTQRTIDVINKQNVQIEVNGRHDACIVPRAVPCVESAVCIAILDEII